MTELETERLKIRPVSIDDADAIHPFYNDPDVQRYLGGWDDIDGTRRFIRSQLRWAEQRGKGGLLVLCDKATGEVVGTAKIDKSPLEPPNDVELTAGLLPAWRGKGLMQEVVPVLVCAGCVEFGSDRVVGVVKPDNTASINMLRRLNAEQVDNRVPPFGGAAEYVFVLRPVATTAGCGRMVFSMTSSRRYSNPGEYKGKDPQKKFEQQERDKAAVRIDEYLNKCRETGTGPIVTFDQISREMSLSLVTVRQLLAAHGQNGITI